MINKKTKKLNDIDKRLTKVEEYINAVVVEDDFDDLRKLVEELVVAEKGWEAFFTKKVDVDSKKIEIIKKMQDMKRDNTKKEFYGWYNKVSYNNGYFENTKNAILGAVVSVYIVFFKDFFEYLVNIITCIVTIVLKIQLNEVISKFIVFFLTTMVFVFLIKTVREDMRIKKVYDFVKNEIDILFLED